jgi:hypothetical protein
MARRTNADRRTDAETTAADLVRRAADRGVDLLADTYRFDRDIQNCPGGLRLLTGTDDDGGELVVVDGTERRAGTWYVTLRFPERQHVDGDYTYEVTAESFYNRIDADGGWFEVPTAARRDGATVNCPICGSFMTVHEGKVDFDGRAVDDRFAFAGCRCGHTVTHEYLVDEGAVVEVW